MFWKTNKEKRPESGEMIYVIKKDNAFPLKYYHKRIDWEDVVYWETIENIVEEMDRVNLYLENAVKMYSETSEMLSCINKEITKLDNKIKGMKNDF